MGLTPPRVVCFDLGNVLIAWDPFVAISAGVGDQAAREFLDGFDFLAWNHLQDSGGTWAAGLASVEASHPHWSTAARAYYDHFGLSLTGEVAGTADVVRHLHAAGVPLIGLTNWSHELYPHAPARFDVLALLDDVVVSGTERMAKPDPPIFHVMAARAGVPPSDIVFVDDSPRNVAAAAALGIDAIRFTDAETLRVELRERGLPV